LKRWPLDGNAKSPDAGRDQDGADLPPASELERLLALGPVVVGTGCGLGEDGDHLVPGALGKCGQIADLPLAGLIVGRDPAVDRRLQ
jgi:hypothetical protein